MQFLYDGNGVGPELGASSTVKRYELSKPFCLVWLVWIGIITVFVFAALILGESRPDGPPAWVVVLVTVVFAWMLYAMVLRVPYELKIHDDNSIEFRSLLGWKVILPSQIKSIKTRPLSLGEILVKHGGGTIYLVHHIDGFYDFVWNVKQLNPEIEIRGC